MPATSRPTAAGRLPCSQDIRPTPARAATVFQGVSALIRFAEWCLLLCFAHALLSTAVYADAMTPQASPQELASTAMVGGPFPVRSLSPIQLLYFQFTPERAITLPRGVWNVRFDLVEANMLASDANGEDSFLFDFELTRANLALQYGVLDHLAVGLEIPLMYTWRGVLDEPIKLFEEVTDFKPTIRFDRPRHLFSYIL
jgi:Protein of unknown function (DUF3187)